MCKLLISLPGFVFYFKQWREERSERLQEIVVILELKK